MTDISELLVVLVLLYGYECLHVVPETCIGLQSLWLGRFRLRRPAGLGFLRGRASFIGMPLPPLGTLLVTQRWPLLVAPRGVLVAGEDAVIPWEALGQVTVEHAQLLLNREPLARLESEPAAMELAALLRKVAGASEKERPRLIERALGRRFDPAVVRERHERYRRAVRWLRVPASLLFVVIFAGIPALVYTELGHHWPYFLGLGMASWIGTGVLFRRALRVGREREEWPSGQKRVGVWLSPIAAIRAPDLVAHALLPGSEPLAAAAALLELSEFEGVARETLAELTHAVEEERPAGEGREPKEDGAAEIRRWYRERLTRETRRLIEAQGLRPDELLHPPAREDESCRTYCPRCQAQYTQTEGRCVSCLEMPLLPLAGADAGADPGSR